MSVWADSNRPAFIQTTGDNIYPVGIHSWDDSQVDSKWRRVYEQPSLRNLVWRVALGNHDYGVRLTEEWNQVPLLCTYNFSFYSNAMCFTPSTGPLRDRVIHACSRHTMGRSLVDVLNILTIEESGKQAGVSWHLLTTSFDSFINNVICVYRATTLAISECSDCRVDTQY